MLTRQEAFRISYYSLGFTILTLVGIPVGFSIMSRNNSGWGFLSDDIQFLSVSLFLIISFMLVSLFSGIYAYKQHRIVAIWLIPLCICLIIALGGLVWGAYVYMAEPFA